VRFYVFVKLDIKNYQTLAARQNLLVTIDGNQFFVRSSEIGYAVIPGSKGLEPNKNVSVSLRGSDSF